MSAYHCAKVRSKAPNDAIMSRSICAACQCTLEFGSTTSSIRMREWFSKARIKFFRIATHFSSG